MGRKECPICKGRGYDGWDEYTELSCAWCYAKDKIDRLKEELEEAILLMIGGEIGRIEEDIELYEKWADKYGKMDSRDRSWYRYDTPTKYKKCKYRGECGRLELLIDDCIMCDKFEKK